MATLQIDKQELDERVAILKRYKKLLEQQRSKFQEYLTTLEIQHTKIQNNDSESALMHTAIQEQLISSISGLQKVILPMQEMYNTSIVNTASMPDRQNEISVIQSELNKLHTKIIAQNQINRNLLQTHMAQINASISNLNAHNPYRGKRSIYAEYAATPSGNLLHIEA